MRTPSSFLFILALSFTSPAYAQVSLVADINPGEAGSAPHGFTPYEDRLFFTAYDDAHGSELWAYDAERGATLVADLYSGSFGAGPSAFTVYDGRLLFTALGPASDDVRLWAYDSATGEATVLADVTLRSRFASYAGKLIFTTCCSAEALWSYDIATGEVGPIAGTSTFSIVSPFDFAVYSERLYFRAYSDAVGHELFYYDAATGEVGLAADINPDGDGYPNQLTLYGGLLFFSARDGGANEELWAYDAAAGGASLVADVSPASNPNGSLPRNLTLYDGHLFFSVLAEDYSRDLWAYDADTDATTFVANASSGMGELNGMAIFDGRLFFAGGANGADLQAYDATTGEVSVVAKGLTPLSLTAYEDHLFFSADSSSGPGPRYGRELWSYSLPTTDTEQDESSRYPSRGAHLSSAYPNPARRSATLTLLLPAPERVRVTAHDLLGREVAVLHEGLLTASTAHPLVLHAAHLPAGLYLVRAKGDTFTDMRRITVVR